jgi:hypothetical protein
MEVSGQLHTPATLPEENIRMDGTTSPLPIFFVVWYLVNHKDNFTFLREGTDWMHLVQDETSGRLL